VVNRLDGHDRPGPAVWFRHAGRGRGAGGGGQPPCRARREADHGVGPVKAGQEAGGGIGPVAGQVEAIRDHGLLTQLGYGEDLVDPVSARAAV
jgi:hypothetical protein